MAYSDELRAARASPEIITKSEEIEAMEREESALLASASGVPLFKRPASFTRALHDLQQRKHAAMAELEALAGAD